MSHFRVVGGKRRTEILYQNFTITLFGEPTGSRGDGHLAALIKTVVKKLLKMFGNVNEKLQRAVDWLEVRRSSTSIIGLGYA